MPTICIFAASSDACHDKYKVWAEEIAAKLATDHWDLVFGGSDMGLMAVLARTFKSLNRRVISVIPHEFDNRCLPFPESDEIIKVHGLRLRKQEMATRADAFLALTGGCGTLDEFNEVLTLKHLNLASEPLVLFNPDDYWRPFLDMLERMDQERFSRVPSKDLFVSAATVNEVMNALR